MNRLSNRSSALREQRRLRLTALTVFALLLVAAACSGGGHSTSSATTQKTPSTTSSAALPLPCPAKGHSVAASVNGVGTPVSTRKPSSNVTWAGVFERVFVTDGPDGSPRKTPHQLTYVAAAGHGPTTVDVPMSSSHLHRRSHGKKPQVVNGVAHVQMDPSGSEVNRLDSDYERPLPVTVKVTYQVNGHPISSSDVKGASGKVRINYSLTNTTAKAVPVCFMGFNGKQVRRTVTEPAPILAYMSITVPKNVSQFSAPGGFYNADRKGVNPQWIVGLFKPMGPSHQNVVFTMNTTKAKIPTATLLVETLDPSSITGNAPAKSAAAVGQAQAATASAVGAVQSDIAALQLKASGSGASSKTSNSGKANRSRASLPRVNLAGSPAVLAHLQAQIATLGRSIVTFSSGVASQATADETNAEASINRMAQNLSEQIDKLATSSDRVINDEGAATRHAVDMLKRRIRAAIDRPALNRVADTAKRLQSAATDVDTHTTALASNVAALNTAVTTLVAGLPSPVQDAMQLHQDIAQISQDLAALPGVQTTSAAYQKLTSDISAAGSLATTLSNSLGQLESQVQAIASRVQTLQGDVTTLQARVQQLVAASILNVTSTAQVTLAKAVRGLDSRFVAAAAFAHHEMSTIAADSRARVAALRKRAMGDVSARETGAKRELAAAVARAKATVTASRAKITRFLASINARVHAALEAAREKAKEGGQAALASAQASAAKAMSAAQQALGAANKDYAEYLAIRQQAAANELPGGNANGITEEDGSLIYTIKGS